VSLIDPSSPSPSPWQPGGGAERLAVRLRFGHVRVGATFACRTAASGLLPALVHACDPSDGPADATITVRRRVDAVTELNWWEQAAPLRVSLSRVLGADTRRVIHASVVGDDRGACAIVGPPTSGKTTAALAAVRGGLGFLGDDYVLLGAGPRFEIVCLYSTACVRTRAGDGRKDVINVGAAHPGTLRRALPLRAVVVARASEGRTCWRRIEPAVALRAWAPSTTLLLTGDHGAALPMLAAVVRTVPCYSLGLGDDPVGIAVAVHELLDAAGSPS
jgi:hypothetical protein